MNIVILTGRFGLGHFRCALAIKEKIEKENKEANVEVIDIIQYLFPKMNKSIYGVFNALVSGMSRTYNYLNRVAEKYKGVPLKRKVCEKLDRLVEDYNPDLVIANLPIGVQYFSDYKKKMKSKIPLFVYITDIYVHKDWVATNANAYFVGDDAAKKSLIAKGVARNIIHTTGIPVSDEFGWDKHEVNECHESKILVMGGGLGLIPGGMKILDILNKTEGVKTTLVCGKNEKLERNAREAYENIEVIGYTEEIPKIMADSDILITKPGGISTFEAIKSGTPLLILNPTLDQELGNASFIQEKVIGKIIYDMDDASPDRIVDFVLDKAFLNQIKENMKKLEKTFEPINPIGYLEKMV